LVHVPILPAAREHVEAFASAILVHFDVDAIDSADLPLANYPHHGNGLTFDAAMTVRRELYASPVFTGLALTEISPTHDPGGALLSRYADWVASALAGPPHRPTNVEKGTPGPPKDRSQQRPLTACFCDANPRPDRSGALFRRA
jgi:Arginase family